MQGWARLNAQAAALVLLERMFPDTLEMLGALDNEAAWLSDLVSQKGAQQQAIVDALRVLSTVDFVRFLPV